MATVPITIIIFILLAAGFTFIQPLQYESDFKMLVIHNFGTNTDPYVASKSNEYLSGILAKVIYSNSFFEKVNKVGFKINKDYFGKDTEEQMKNWKKAVVAKNISDTGIISVNIYHPDKYQAQQIARAIIFSLQASHKLYHGYGDNVTIKIVDEPLTSKKPVKPNIVLNLMAAVILGFILSLTYIYLFPEAKYSLRLWPKRNQKSIPSTRDENQIDKDESFYNKKDNWERVGDILEKNNYPYSPWHDLEEDKPEIIENENNNFGQSNLGS